MATKKFILAEKDIPQAWYNVIADMPNKPMSPLNPATKSPLAVEDLYPIFAEELCKQELNTSDAWIEIPEEVRDMYKIWRPTPLVRALGLEKALDTPAHIYFKNESVSPVGSHKLNSAIPQAYYCKKQGITNITTETGAGQWGAALSLAAKVFGLELAVYMVKVSFHQKPYRRSIMQTFGAQAILNKEIYAQGNTADEEAFGYQEAWADYRYKPSKVTGLFRSNAAQSLDAWHYAQDYDALPTLSTAWMEQTDTEMKRTLAVQSQPDFIADFYFMNKTTRCMPVYSIPGLIDHH